MKGSILKDTTRYIRFIIDNAEEMTHSEMAIDLGISDRKISRIVRYYKIPNTIKNNNTACPVTLLNKDYKLVKDYPSVNELKRNYHLLISLNKNYTRWNFSAEMLKMIRSGKAITFYKHIIVSTEHFQAGSYELASKTLASRKKKEKDKEKKKEEKKRLIDHAILSIGEDLTVIDKYTGKLKDFVEINGFTNSAFKSRLSRVTKTLMNHIDSNGRSRLRFPTYIYQKDYNKLEEKIKSYQNYKKNEQ